MQSISVDGGQTWATTTPPPGPIEPAQDLGIGWDIGQNNYWFRGMVDDVRFYDWPLSTNEIKIVSEGGQGFPLVRNPVPEDGAMLEATWVNLSWKPGSYAVSHDVYLGDNLDDVINGTGDTFRGNQASAFLAAGFSGYAYPDGLVPGTTYYRRVDEVNDANVASPWKGDVWSFTVISKTAYHPFPPDGAEFVETDVILNWTPGLNAILHTVYFGTDAMAVKQADISDAAGIYRGRQNTTTYSPPEGIEWGGGPYYWRVDEYNADGIISKGSVWSFTVADFIGIDDFEDYNAGDNQIWYAWKDGLGYGAPGSDPYYPGNGTGAAVGDETTASYMEETIVHGGGKSMPIAYDNNKQGYTKYSEVERTLTTHQDWTEQGVAELSLWFYGYAANADEPLYVAVSNITGASAIVVHDDPAVATTEKWTEWIIPLQAFTDQGIDQTNVDRIAIGLGTRGNTTVPGGSGKMYFDDMRLYRPRETAE